jgi:hypothetical protein
MSCFDVMNDVQKDLQDVSAGTGFLTKILAI